MSCFNMFYIELQSIFFNLKKLNSQISRLENLEISENKQMLQTVRFQIVKVATF